MRRAVIDTLTGVTDIQAPDRTAPNAQRAWFIGGALLLATVVLTVADQPALSQIVNGPLIATALFSAALLVFAYGVRGAGSLTARRPLGTAALTVLAVWSLLESVLTGLLPSGFPNDAIPSTLLLFGYVDSLLRFAVALGAVVQIARVGALPPPRNWAPAVALAAVCIPWLLGQIGAVGASHGEPTTLMLAIGAMDGVGRIDSTVFLCVLAIVLADRLGRQRRAPVASTPVAR
jgi:hypothetical protein